MAPIRRKSTVFPYRGKWRLLYLDGLGNTRTLTLSSQQEAYLKLAEIEGGIRQGFLSPNPAMLPSLGAWLDYWLTVRKLELSPTTWQGYEASCRNWIRPALGHLRLDTVTPAQIQSLYSMLQEKHQLSAGTLRRMHSLFSSAFSLAMSQGLLMRNPLAGVTKPRLTQRPIDVFSPNEMQQLQLAISQLPALEQLRWLLALRYGLRQGEALGLKRSDFDLASLTLKIQRTVNSLPGQGVVELLVKSKNALRTIPIDAQLSQLVMSVSVSMSDEGYLFPSACGRALEASIDRRRWQKLLAESGVRSLPLHAARHSVATSMMRQGVNPRVVQMLLGHSSPAYTLATYVHPGIEELRQALGSTSSLAIGGGVWGQ